MRGLGGLAFGFAASLALVATTNAIEVDQASCSPRVTDIQQAANEAQLLSSTAVNAIAQQGTPGGPESLALSLARSLFGNDPQDAALRLKTVGGELRPGVSPRETSL